MGGGGGGGPEGENSGPWEVTKKHVIAENELIYHYLCNACFAIVIEGDIAIGRWSTECLEAARSIPHIPVLPIYVSAHPPPPMPYYQKKILQPMQMSQIKLQVDGKE